MKIKKNELLQVEIVETGKEVFFTAAEAKGLQGNSRNLRYWDGSNWKEEEINCIGIVKYIEDEDQPDQPNPQYTTMWDVEIGGEWTRLLSSNMSGSLTPYWEEDSYEY